MSLFPECFYCVGVVAIERTPFLKFLCYIYLKQLLLTMASLTLPRNASRRGALNRALSHLKVCGCHTLWEQFTHLTIEGKACQIVCTRLELCISEKYWDTQDVDASSLTEDDKSQPFPEVVRRSLLQKLKAAKSCKRLAFSKANNSRLRLQE